jgi:hypothetical protein
MPVHDWTRVEAGIFHDFHTVWAVAIRNALNDGLLPKGYYVMAIMPLFLRPDRYVNVPLESTYQDRYRSMPQFWRDILEGRHSGNS